MVLSGVFDESETILNRNIPEGMQIIMSPAKLLSYDESENQLKATAPQFLDKTSPLVDVCQQLSVDEIAKLMAVNSSIANDVYGYFQAFNQRRTPKKAAALAYNGIAYKGLHASDFDKQDYLFAQSHLNIISGLYGILRPFDAIKPYRLEFSRKITPKGVKTLYDYWQETLNTYLAKKLKQDDGYIINVASKEYSKVVAKKLLPKGTKIIDINFLQQDTTGYKQIVVHTKKARGMVARFIIKNKLTNVEDVKGFDTEGYFFSPAHSSETSWTFVR